MVTFTPEEADTVRARVAAWVSDPEVPVKTTFALPAWALLPAVSVTLCGVPGVSETEAGSAVIPAANPLSATLTLPVKPLSAVPVTCTGCPAPPMVRLRDAGLTASEKSAWAGAGAVTVMANEAVCVRAPDVPVSVAVAEPAAVPAGAVSVSVAAVPGVSVRVDGWTVTPVGSPVIATCTLDENPFCAVASTETVPAVPLAVKVRVAGVTLSEKSAGAAACTEREACVLTLWLLALAVKVTMAVAAAADDAAVIINGKATPGVSESVAGETVTPLGRPDTATVVAPVPLAAVNSREAGCAAAPAVRWKVEGERVSVG